MFVVQKFKELEIKGTNLGLYSLAFLKHLIAYISLLITKLSWYEVKTKSPNLIFSYLRNSIHSVRIKSIYSIKCEIMYGAPQGSVLGPDYKKNSF